MFDPVAFAQTCGVRPDPWQAQVLRSKSRRIILCCCRQSGKSTTIAIRVAHRAIYRPNWLALCIAPSFRQSSLLFEKIADNIKKNPAAPARLEDNKTQLELANGSRVITLPDNPDTIRGFTPNEVLVDEAAWVSDETFAALRPMLIVSGGELALLSTPYGKRGEFYETWERGGQDWERLQVKADDCPRISAHELERERREMPAWLFRQEYGCEFVETLDSVFTHDQVQGVLERGEELQL